jgi:hypothetical protein
MINYFRIALMVLMPCFLYGQDNIFIYDLQTQNINSVILPAFSNAIVSDSTNAYIDTLGFTSLPTAIPSIVYPNTSISIIENASHFYSTFNFPFAALTRINYGLKISAAVIGRRALLVYYFDVRDYNSAQWRNLHDCNPYFDNGAIMYGGMQLHPLRYYTLDTTLQGIYNPQLAVIEVAEDVGKLGGYFGLEFDTTLHGYDSLLLYNLSYPNQGYPAYYSSPVNGDTMCLKYGLITNPDSTSFGAYYGGDGEYTSPYFDKNFRIRGTRYSTQANLKLSRKDFYFLKYVTNSLATDLQEIPDVSGFTLYPVPASTELYMEVSFDQNVSFTVYDLIGKEIKSGVFIRQTTFRVDDLPDGIYFISLTSGKENWVKKFIKSHG